MEMNDRELSFTLLIQDASAKSKEKKLKFTCLDKVAYLRWTGYIKVTQRPQWADPEVDCCYICETFFDLFNRQHHCRKCGTVSEDYAL